MGRPLAQPLVATTVAAARSALHCRFRHLNTEESTERTKVCLRSELAMKGRKLRVQILVKFLIHVRVGSWLITRPYVRGELPERAAVTSDGALAAVNALAA